MIYIYIYILYIFTLCIYIYILYIIIYIYIILCIYNICVYIYYILWIWYQTTCCHFTGFRDHSSTLAFLSLPRSRKPNLAIWSTQEQCNLSWSNLSSGNPFESRRLCKCPTNGGGYYQITKKHFTHMWPSCRPMKLENETPSITIPICTQ